LKRQKKLTFNVEANGQIEVIADEAKWKEDQPMATVKMAEEIEGN
jgi:hypothetical protein